MYSRVFDARNTQVELVKQKYTKRVFDVAFDVFAPDSLSTLGGTSLFKEGAGRLSAMLVLLPGFRFARVHLVAQPATRRNPSQTTR